MYTVQRYEPEIRLISREGVEKVYPNYEAFLEDMTYSFVESRVLTTFKDENLNWFLVGLFYKEVKPPHFVVRDEFGSVFSRDEILADLNRKRFEQIRNSRWHKLRHDFLYRRTPVPHTGKRKWYFKHFYKTPRHIQEKKWNIAHKEYVRGKRSPANLQNPWDDYKRSDAGIKSWKNQKIKRQWMKKLRA